MDEAAAGEADSPESFPFGTQQHLFLQHNAHAHDEIVGCHAGYMPRFGLNFGLGREIAIAPIGDMDAGILVADDAHSLFHFFLLTGYDGNTLALLEGMA